MKKIAAVVVTYNRKKLLSKCIDSILNQTMNLDIIVIDNMSTDGTYEMLNNLIREKKIIYRSTGKNIGGAGGFNMGLRVAYELGYEYFWLMDDDCIPTKDALKHLIDFGNSVDNKFGFISSKVLWKDNKICKMNIPKISLGQHVTDFSKAVIPIKMATFVSFLTRRAVVEKIGLPIKDFFIWGDDIEYSQRISKKYPSYLVTDSVVHHETKNNVGSNIAIDDYSRINRYELAYRNEAFLFREIGVKGRLYQSLRLGLHSIRIMTKAKDHKKERFNILLKGTRLGRKFNPSIEMIKGNK
ncbi:glycosyltransferase family 2 protein [Lactobacillus crispatus]|uniref:glycosyltransferase family 2 protein n=1 Tax=Lactobacillus crispatus TaxID=47770 RepID=UPI003D6B756E